MSVKKLKHLEFIENVITRMNSNSYMIKGWSAAIVVGLFALAEKTSSAYYLFIPFFSVMGFWLLDALFYAKEKRFQKLYDKVRQTNDDDIDFCMSTEEYKRDADCKWFRTFRSLTLKTFHGLMLLTVAVVAVFGFLSSCGETKPTATPTTPRPEPTATPMVIQSPTETATPLIFPPMSPRADSMPPKPDSGTVLLSEHVDSIDTKGI